eukprot:1087108-Rhodomonas_salina.1
MPSQIQKSCSGWGVAFGGASKTVTRPRKPEERKLSVGSGAYVCTALVGADRARAAHPLVVGTVEIVPVVAADADRVQILEDLPARGARRGHGLSHNRVLDVIGTFFVGALQARMVGWERKAHDGRALISYHPFPGLSARG